MFGFLHQKNMPYILYTDY